MCLEQPFKTKEVSKEDKPFELKGRSAEDVDTRSSLFFRHDLKYSSMLCKRQWWKKYLELLLNSKC